MGFVFCHVHVVLLDGSAKDVEGGDGGGGDRDVNAECGGGDDDDLNGRKGWRHEALGDGCDVRIRMTHGPDGRGTQ